MERNTVDIIATELQLLGSREAVAVAATKVAAMAVVATRNDPQQQRPVQQRQRLRRPSAPSAPAANNFEDHDDDIPF